MTRHAWDWQVVLKLRSATNFDLFTLYPVSSLVKERRVILLEIQKYPWHLIRSITTNITICNLRSLPSIPRYIEQINYFQHCIINLRYFISSKSSSWITYFWSLFSILPFKIVLIILCMQYQFSRFRIDIINDDILRNFWLLSFL